LGLETRPKTLLREVAARLSIDALTRCCIFDVALTFITLTTPSCMIFFQKQILVHTVMSTTKTSGGYRAIEIILGLVALAVGVLALFFPQTVVVTLVVLFGIALLIVGVLRLATAASSEWLQGSARKTNSIIGILAITIGAVMLFFPLLAAATLVILIGLGLLIYGIGRIIVGATGGNLHGGLRALLIIIGIIIVAFSLIVIFFPIYSYAVFVSISFILIGIDSLASGIAGTPSMI
jgi:uncharacterized membrane protein HdeD (DUF308 family)